MVYNLGEVQPGCRVEEFPADTTIAKYAIVQINADGEAVTYDGTAAPTGIVGIALDAAAAANDIVRVAFDGAVAIAAPADVKKGGLVVVTKTSIGAATIGYALEEASSGAAVLVKLAPVATWKSLAA